MFSAFRFGSFVALLALTVSLLGRPASADTFTYSETIEDLDNSTFFVWDYGQDLERTRVYGDGSVEVTSDDGTIIAENDAAGFGLSSISDITWTHTFIGIPPADSFISATIEITAFGASGEKIKTGRRSYITVDNDHVYVDGQFVGLLDADGAFHTTTTAFDLNGDGEEDEVDLGILLADGEMQVTVTPKGPGIFGFGPDAISVQKSTFDVVYSSAVASTPNTAFVLFGGMGSGTFGSGYFNILNLGGLTDTAPYPMVVTNGPINLPAGNTPQEFFFLGGGDFTGFSPHILEGTETFSDGTFVEPDPVDPALQAIIVQGLATISVLDPMLGETGGYAQGIPIDSLINHILSFAPPGQFSYEQVYNQLFDGGYTQFSDGMGEEVVFFFDKTYAGSLLIGQPTAQGGLLNVTYEPVPEPGSLLLVCGAFAGAALLRRRRRAA